MFRVGQRVICVDDTPTHGFRWMDGDKPIVGQVYTVVGFEIANGAPCIFTAECPRWSFRARRFRPIAAAPPQPAPVEQAGEVAFMFWNNPDTQRHFTQMREAIGTHWQNIVPLYTTPQPAPGFAEGFEACREALENIKTAILEAPIEVIADTFWMPDRLFKGGTVVDYIDHAIASLRSPAAPEGAKEVTGWQLEPWRDELSEIIGHLGSAITQSTNSDDRIIMDHVRAAHEIAKIVRRKA